jgi:hypothetical protein
MTSGWRENRAIIWFKFKRVYFRSNYFITSRCQKWVYFHSGIDWLLCLLRCDSVLFWKELPTLGGTHCLQSILKLDAVCSSRSRKFLPKHDTVALKGTWRELFAHLFIDHLKVKLKCSLVSQTFRIFSKMAVFWVVAPCSLVEVCQRFRGPCCLYHQGDEFIDRKTAIFVLTAVRTSNPTEDIFLSLLLFLRSKL